MKFRELLERKVSVKLTQEDIDWMVDDLESSGEKEFAKQLEKEGKYKTPEIQYIINYIKDYIKDED